MIEFVLFDYDQPDNWDKFAEIKLMINRVRIAGYTIVEKSSRSTTQGPSTKLIVQFSDYEEAMWFKLTHL